MYSVWTFQTVYSVFNMSHDYDAMGELQKFNLFFSTEIWYDVFGSLVELIILKKKRAKMFDCASYKKNDNS